MRGALAVRTAGIRLQAAWPVHLAGKRVGRGQLNAVAPGCLLHLFDDVSQRRFLVDTGAAYSVFPHKSLSISSGPQLTGAGGQVIECWGEQRMNLCFHGRQFQWTFLLADVQLPILGADFYVISGWLWIWQPVSCWTLSPWSDLGQPPQLAAVL